MTLKFYYDLLSQPSRAIFIFLKVNNIPFEAVPVALRKGEQLKKEYKEINRFHSLPAIDDNGFKIFESIAILRYLCREKSVADHWFPKQSQNQARVDEYLEWQHHNTRFLCNFYFQRKYIMPLRTGNPTPEHLIEEARDRMTDCFEKIDQTWLDKKNYIAGTDDISIADLLGVCEIEQTKLTGFDVKPDFPQIAAWMDRVKQKLNPHFDEAHTIIYKLAQKAQQGKN